jgi:hypothetical protein
MIRKKASETLIPPLSDSGFSWQTTKQKVEESPPSESIPKEDGCPSSGLPRISVLKSVLAINKTIQTLEDLKKEITKDSS